MATVEGGWNMNRYWNEVRKYSPTESHGLLTWHDATTYSQWVGKSLSTEAEWEYATLGGLINKRYVWGRDEPDGTKSNMVIRVRTLVCDR